MLLLDGCRDRLTVVYPPDRVEYLTVDGFAVVPNAGEPNAAAPE